MLVLASQSPRRKELLAQLQVSFDTISADIDETVLANESPTDYVERLSIEKAQAVRPQCDEQAVILGSDTCVVIEDEILGKPVNFEDSLTMLRKLSGATHQVYTGIAAIQGDKVKSQVVTTHVTFKLLSDDEISGYWHSNEPQDKAGSYGIQGLGGQFVEKIDGSFSAVVGLPLVETSALLTNMKVAVGFAKGDK